RLLKSNTYKLSGLRQLNESGCILTDFKTYSNQTQSKYYNKPGMAGYIVDDSTVTDDKAVIISREDYLKPRIEEFEEYIEGDEQLGIKGSYIKKFDPLTLKHKYNQNTSTIHLPELVNQKISELLLKQYNIRTFKENFKKFLDKCFSNTTNLNNISKSALETDLYIVSNYHRDYASNYQSLMELKMKVNNELITKNGDLNTERFNPKKILNISNGPATGLLALNELMKDDPDFQPEVCEAWCLGSESMANRAKWFLSSYPKQRNHKSKNKTDDKKFVEYKINDKGKINYENITIQTKFLKKMPAPISSDENNNEKLNSYDLIILEHSLLKSEKKFPLEVEFNLKKALRVLKPNGHLIIIEKGNPLGFEVIAKARDFMLQPTRYEENESGGKIPRPYLESLKKHKIHTEGLESSEEKELSDEFLEEKEYILNKEKEKSQYKFDTNYYMSVVAPCSHHNNCPLQLKDPEFFFLKSGKQMKTCTNQKKVELPKYYMELNRGKLFDKKYQSYENKLDEFNNIKAKEDFDNKETGIDKPQSSFNLSKPQLVSGRENKQNYVITSYSYLIMKRTSNDPQTIKAIENERLDAINTGTKQYKLGYIGKNDSELPRILNTDKKKGHINMTLCAPSGHIEQWSIGKSMTTKQIYHDLKKAAKNDCWPHDSDKYNKRLNNRAGNKQSISKLKKTLYSLKKSEIYHEHEELMQKADELSGLTDGDMKYSSLEEKVEMEARLYEYELGKKTRWGLNEKQKFDKSQYKKALELIKQKKI
ncbi:mitochondrial ribosomal protein, partial [Hanseniaspora valbyensis NRRL Y-1626]